MYIVTCSIVSFFIMLNKSPDQWYKVITLIQNRSGQCSTPDISLSSGSLLRKPILYYPLDRDLYSEQCYPPLEQLGPRCNEINTCIMVVIVNMSLKVVLKEKLRGAEVYLPFTWQNHKFQMENAKQFFHFFQCLQLICIYFVVGHSPTTSNFKVLCLCTRYFTQVVCVGGKHPNTLNL